MINITPETKQSIIVDHHLGLSRDEIEQKYSINRSTLSRRLKEWGIRSRQKTITSNQYQAAVNDLKAGMLMKDVVAKHDIARGSIYRFMHDTEQMFYTDHGRRYNLNKDYFKTIDTEHKAYWLGFIWADGCISKSNETDKSETRLTINISQKDRAILEQFIIDIESNYKIYEYIPSEETYSDHPMSKVVINSVELCRDLRQHGLTLGPSRTFPWKSIPEELHRHFIRGFFDGDGCICESLSFIGYKELLIDIQSILIKDCALNRTKLIAYPNKVAEVYDLRYGGKQQLTRLYHYIYDNTSIYLSRKHDKFLLTISS